MKKLFILFFGFISASTNIMAQSPTVGLLYNNSMAVEGYTLFSPENGTSVFLINNCGEKINEWSFNEGPGLTCYLLDNGNLLRSGKDSIQIKDWYNNLIWSYPTTANNINQHHDIEPLPNGNILCVVSDTYTKAQIVAAGRNPSFSGANFKLDKIIELQPIGTNSATIVWEWKFKDHLIQDFDSTKLNYGVVLNHPELIDINYDNGYNFDWTHLNAVDYDSSLDQIIISSRHLNEIYIIDHSTTTTEAATHTGGNSNKGGDILWRWGNPAVYRQGDTTNQKLFLQHDSKFVEQNYLDEGKISVFNNLGDGSGTFSSIHLITPSRSNYNYNMQSGKFLPLDFEWSWSGSISGNIVFEGKKSGTHALPNGNFIICETSFGRVSEITKTGTQLWTYKNPAGNTIYSQYSAVTNSANSIFRAEKYPSNYPAFIGKSLISLGLIENQNSNSDSCINTVGISQSSSKKYTLINPATNNTIRFVDQVTFDNISVMDLTGKIILSTRKFNGSTLHVNLIPSMYFVFLTIDSKTEVVKLIVE